MHQTVGRNKFAQFRQGLVPQRSNVERLAFGRSPPRPLPLPMPELRKLVPAYRVPMPELRKLVPAYCVPMPELRKLVPAYRLPHGDSYGVCIATSAARSAS